MKTPLVSVVMSVYNGEKHLRKSVESILNQTFRDFEFKIINDGSTDRTKDVLETYAAKDDRIVLIHQEHMGLTKSLNKGISMAKGKYIARQDADDISKPERLEKQVVFMEAHTAVGLASSFFELIDDKGETIRICGLPLDDKTIKERLPELNQFCHGAAVVRRESIEKVGVYREFFKFAQDYDLWLRISERYEVANMREPLYCRRESEEAISSRKLVLQSKYAGAASAMALQRRQTGADEIQRGNKPGLPSIKQLPKGLQNKLVEFYEDHRGKMWERKNIGWYLRDTIMYYRMKFVRS